MTMLLMRAVALMLAAVLVLPVGAASASENAAGKGCDSDGATISVGPITITCYADGGYYWGSARVYSPNVIDYTQEIGRTGTGGAAVDDPNYGADDGEIVLLPYCWAREPGSGNCVQGVAIPAGAYAEPTGEGWSIQLAILGGGGTVGVYGGCVDPNVGTDDCEGPGNGLPGVFFE